MPMSLNAELDWCEFLRRVVDAWGVPDDLHSVAERMGEPHKRLYKALEWLRWVGAAKRAGRLSVANTFRHLYRIDTEQAMAEISRRERSARKEPSQALANCMPLDRAVASMVRMRVAKSRRSRQC